MPNLSHIALGASLVAGIAVFSEALPGGGIGTNAGEGFLSRLMGNISMVASDDETLMGRRSFVGEYHTGYLITSGMAWTFLDQDDPTTFVPYTFGFNGTNFGPLPALSRDEIMAQYQRFDGPALPLTLPGPGNCATAPSGNPVCQLTSPLPNQRPALIGAILPDRDALPLPSGDEACRAEVAAWMVMPEYQDITVALCIVIDRPFDAEAHSSEDWMDVIFYQRFGTRLLNMRAARRNFEHI